MEVGDAIYLSASVMLATGSIKSAKVTDSNIARFVRVVGSERVDKERVDKRSAIVGWLSLIYLRLGGFNQVVMACVSGRPSRLYQILGAGMEPTCEVQKHYSDIRIYYILPDVADSALHESLLRKPIQPGPIHLQRIGGDTKDNQIGLFIGSISSWFVNLSIARNDTGLAFSMLKSCVNDEFGIPEMESSMLSKLFYSGIGIPRVDFLFDSFTVYPSPSDGLLYSFEELSLLEKKKKESNEIAEHKEPSQLAPVASDKTLITRKAFDSRIDGIIASINEFNECSYFVDLDVADWYSIVSTSHESKIDRESLIRGGIDSGWLPLNDKYKNGQNPLKDRVTKKTPGAITTRKTTFIDTIGNKSFDSSVDQSLVKPLAQALALLLISFDDLLDESAFSALLNTCLGNVANDAQIYANSFIATKKESIASDWIWTSGESDAPNVRLYVALLRHVLKKVSIPGMKLGELYKKNSVVIEIKRFSGSISNILAVASCLDGKGCALYSRPIEPQDEEYIQSPIVDY